MYAKNQIKRNLKTNAKLGKMLTECERVLKVKEGKDGTNV